MLFEKEKEVKTEDFISSNEIARGSDAGARFNYRVDRGGITFIQLNQNIRYDNFIFFFFFFNKNKK